VAAFQDEDSYLRLIGLRGVGSLTRSKARRDALWTHTLQTPAGFRYIIKLITVFSQVDSLGVWYKFVNF